MPVRAAGPAHDMVVAGPGKIVGPEQRMVVVG
jgi:hypothetical protein